jgi:N-formylglutamate amidohydrolase
VLLWELHRGDAPLIIDIPHAGTHLPDAIAYRLTAAAHAVPDTDWHVDKLYDFARTAGVTVLAATHSRYVVDLNRDPSGESLYPGADTTELCPTRTFANAPVYAHGQPDQGEVDARTLAFFHPYHAQLAAEIGRVHMRHGYAIVLDGHSIPAVVPRFFEGRLPDLNLGTAGGTSCAPRLEALAVQCLQADPRFSHVVNGRFKGGWITRHYGAPTQGVHTLQLEMAQAAYMDEAHPAPYDGARAAPLAAVLERLVMRLAEWRPQ